MTSVCLGSWAEIRFVLQRLTAVRLASDNCLAFASRTGIPASQRKTRTTEFNGASHSDDAQKGGRKERLVEVYDSDVGP